MRHGMPEIEMNYMYDLNFSAMAHSDKQNCKLQINWVCFACTAGAPVCFHAVPTSYECDYMYIVLL